MATIHSGIIAAESSISIFRGTASFVRISGRAICPSLWHGNQCLSRKGFERAAGLKAKKRQKLCAAAASSARDALEVARQIFEQGDRMGALRQYERAVRQPLTPQERREALYGATVVHASFGDMEQAQMSLREGLECGLDFEAALADETMLKWRSSPQVLSQLKKFARTLRQIREAVKPDSKSRLEVGAGLSDGIDYAASRGRLPKPNSNMSLAEMLGTDISGMDATVTGIVRRVAALLVIGLLLGTALFYAGLEFTGIAR